VIHNILYLHPTCRMLTIFYEILYF